MDPATKMDLGAAASAVSGLASVLVCVGAVALHASHGSLPGAGVLYGVVALVLALVALVLGILALRRIRRAPHLRRGKALAIAGIVLGGPALVTVL